jgi:hypothetical protein
MSIRLLTRSVVQVGRDELSVNQNRRSEIDAGCAADLTYNSLGVVISTTKGGIMTSDKQTEANRRNARKSTGPKTSEGKAAVRLNALKHGLLSQDMLLPGEDEATLRELGERVRADLRPVGELEDLLAEQIVTAIWRLRRLRRAEAGIFAWELYGELAERAQQEARTQEKTGLDQILENTGLTSMILNQQKHQEALSRAQNMKAKQDAETATLGRAFIRDANEANAFSKLSRYEATIERSFYKALHELQRLQAARHTEGSVTPPVAIEVDVSGIPGKGP